VHEHDRWSVPGAAVGEAEAMDLDRVHELDGTPDVTADMVDRLPPEGAPRVAAAPSLRCG
jgi:hypothetical protein